VSDGAAGQEPGGEGGGKQRGEGEPEAPDPGLEDGAALLDRFVEGEQDGLGSFEFRERGFEAPGAQGNVRVGGGEIAAQVIDETDRVSEVRRRPQARKCG